MAKSVYIHLPFCKTKCPYCDFASFTSLRSQEYIDALVKEIELRTQEKQNEAIETIFFGGGTPSMHSADELKQILDILKRKFSFAEDIEISLEANPGTIDAEKLKSYQEIGINRISLGIQSFDAPLLEKLGRGHSLEDSYQAIESIINTGFQSWSLDLIYGLPKQSLESWRQTLSQAISFQPPHISAYALSIEANTPYGEIYKNSQHPLLPQEDDLVEMYKLCHSMLAEARLNCYEISNWALAGHEARHNLTYWEAEEYWAFGLSAHGYLHGHRYANTRDINQYLSKMQSIESPSELKNIESYREFIDTENQIEEKIMLGLRLKKGITLSPEIKAKINLNKLAQFESLGLVKVQKDQIGLSVEGLLVSNNIIGELITDNMLIS